MVHWPPERTSARVQGDGVLRRDEGHGLVVRVQDLGNRIPARGPRIADDVEGDDLVRVGIVDVVLRADVAEGDALTDLVPGEVDDHLVALGADVSQAPDGLWDRHEARVGPDDHQGFSAVQLPSVGPRDRGVEDPEAVLAPLDPHHRPGPAVHEDHVPEGPGLVVVVVEELAGGVEHRVADHQRHVVVALWDRQRLLERIVHPIHPGQPHGDVRGCVVHAVVVIPDRPGVLVVQVVVVLVEARVCDVVGVAVVLRQRCRPMQVDRGVGG